MSTFTESTEPMNTDHQFTALPNWLRGEAAPLEIALLWCLQTHYGNIQVSLNQLAEESGICRRKVASLLSSMESRGWISREQELRDDGGKAPTRYTLHIWGARP